MADEFGAQRYNIRETEAKWQAVWARRRGAGGGPAPGGFPTAPEGPDFGLLRDLIMADVMVRYRRARGGDGLSGHRPATFRAAPGGRGGPKRNRIDLKRVLATYGIDATRWYLLSNSPPGRDPGWSDDGVYGAWRFVNRLWRLIAPAQCADRIDDPGAEAASHTLRRHIHRTVEAFTEDLDALRFNCAVARIHQLANALGARSANSASVAVRREGLKAIARLIAPMMPHLAEELWFRLGHRTRLTDAPWPEAEASLTAGGTARVAVQVGGKLRASIELPRDTGRRLAVEAALAVPAVATAIDGRKIDRIIFVPNRIINVVQI